VRTAVKRFDLSESDKDTWGFLCECGDSECEEWVTLSVPDYEVLRKAARPILAHGHTVNRQQRSRRTAQRLIEEARALGRRPNSRSSERLGTSRTPGRAR
jgi:hypothetical protein